MIKFKLKKQKTPFNQLLRLILKLLIVLNTRIWIRQKKFMKKQVFFRFKLKEINKKGQRNVYRPAQCLQCMVKIKYNNMMISKNLSTVQQQPFRRKLRSQSRQSPKDCHAAVTSSDEKAIQQIQKQFDNQQSINGTKSTGPVQDQLKVGLFQSALFCMRTRRTRYEDLPKSKPEDVVRESPTKQTLEEVVSPVVTRTIQEVKPQSPEPWCEPEVYLTPVKRQVHNFRTDQNLVLKVSRRSGRRQNRNGVNQVPFRKFQDSFEQKIVVLINRIYQRKRNEKEIELFAQKLYKMSLKELYNPYVISGVQTVLNLLERPSLSQTPHVTKLCEQMKKVSARIWEQLGKTKDYEEVHIEQREVNLEEFRPKFIKKIYRMLLETQKYGLKEAQEKSFAISDSFFSNCNNYSRQQDILCFFREQKYLTC